MGQIAERIFSYVDPGIDVPGPLNATPIESGLDLAGTETIADDANPLAAGNARVQQESVDWAPVAVAVGAFVLVDGVAIAYVLMLGTNLLVYIFLPQLSGLYGLTAETTAVVHDLLLWHCIFASLFYPAGFCIPAALRAAGDVRYPMVISVAS